MASSPTQILYANFLQSAVGASDAAQMLHMLLCIPEKLDF
jgi:hypothetical protein